MSTEGRYDLLESVSMAFLVALEALSPRQRAVLLLRDVFDYTVAETAFALKMSDANVKTSLHRARKAMAVYDTKRLVPSADLRARAQDTLDAFVEALASRRLARIEALLASDVCEISDGGGEFVAALRPIMGARAVARFLIGITPADRRSYRLERREINGMPAIVGYFFASAPKQASRFVIAPEVGEDGKIRALRSILATHKLTAVSFDD